MIEKSRLFIIILFFLTGSVLFGQSANENYDSPGTVCYVDSVNGGDRNDGLSESTPKRTEAAIP